MADFDYYGNKLSYFAEWHDHETSYNKRFIMSYYPSDQTLELYDRDLNRVFFKRTKMEDVNFDDIFVGNTIKIYGRHINITDYADRRTKDFVGRTHETTFALIKPSVMNQLGEIMVEIRNRGWRIYKMRMCQLTRKEAIDIYSSSIGDSYLNFVLEELVSGPSVAMEIMGENAVERWKETVGPEDPLEAKKVAPTSLRAIYGHDNKALNGFHAAENTEQALKQSNYFFPRSSNQPTPHPALILVNTTCCVIKPHAIRDGQLGPILIAIREAHFKVNAMQMFYLSTANVEEFLEVYKGVVPDFRSVMDSFIDGPCIGLEIAGENDSVNVQQEFRKLCGPPDPEVGRQIRPYTLRAKFGLDKYKNAVHCTDLPEDTVLDLEYLFKIVKK